MGARKQRTGDGGMRCMDLEAEFKVSFWNSIPPKRAGTVPGQQESVM